MKNKKITIITNFILIAVFTLVFAVSFLSQPAVPISVYDKTIAPIYNGNKSKKNVSLMFNVYENETIVNEIIKVLNSYKIKATFFVGGCWADDNEQTLKNIVESGNEIANHGYFHKDHSTISYERNKQEIINTQTIICSATGVNTNLFAPPSGSYSEVTLSVASELGYKTILWSKDTIDWRDKDEQKVYSRATKNLSNGDLILMHPKEHTLSALPKIIEYCLNNGFNIVTVSENIK